MVFLGGTYIAATEFISAKKSKGEVLVFRRRHASALTKQKIAADPEAASIGGATVTAEILRPQVSAHLATQTSIFHWKDVCFDIRVKNETRRLLDHVDGWVKPGTLTALMVGTASLCNEQHGLTARLGCFGRRKDDLT
jgi:ATP-binding cassette, subfamily G (WHITE), member 2, PDR